MEGDSLPGELMSREAIDNHLEVIFHSLYHHLVHGGVDVFGTTPLARQKMIHNIRSR
jgi:hypothetical protein